MLHRGSLLLLLLFNHIKTFQKYEKFADALRLGRPYIGSQPSTPVKVEPVLTAIDQVPTLAQVMAFSRERP
jgi:hypothetical protein